jgi:hypothetical protein
VKLIAFVIASLMPPSMASEKVKLDAWYVPPGYSCAEGYHLDVQANCADLFNDETPRVRVVCHSDDVKPDLDDDPCGAVCVRARLDGDLYE